MITNQGREEKRQLWISRLSDLGDSGMTQEEWCKSRSIPYSGLRYWVTKLRKETTAENHRTNWLKVDVSPGNEIVTIRPQEEIKDGGGICIRFKEFAVELSRSSTHDQLLDVLRTLKAL